MSAADDLVQIRERGTATVRLRRVPTVEEWQRILESATVRIGFTRTFHSATGWNFAAALKTRPRPRTIEMAELEWGDNQLFLRDWAASDAPLESVERVSIGQCDGIELLPSILKTLPNLTDLEFSANRGDLSAIFELIPKFNPRLRGLRFSVQGASIDPNSLSALTYLVDSTRFQLQSFSCVQHAYMPAEQIIQFWSPILKTLANNTTITDLQLSNTLIDFRPNPAVKSLSLWNKRIDSLTELLKYLQSDECMIESFQIAYTSKVICDTLVNMCQKRLRRLHLQIVDKEFTIVCPQLVNLESLETSLYNDDFPKAFPPQLQTLTLNHGATIFLSRCVTPIRTRKTDAERIRFDHLCELSIGLYPQDQPTFALCASNFPSLKSVHVTLDNYSNLDKRDETVTRFWPHLAMFAKSAPTLEHAAVSFVGEWEVELGDKLSGVLQRRAEMRRNWKALSMLLAFVRANRTHAFRYSVFPLLRQILIQGAERWAQNVLTTVNLDKLLDSRFATNVVNTTLVAPPISITNVRRSDRKSKALH